MTPSHWDATTWPRCVKPGCRELVDPWDHNTRCREHRPDPADNLTITRHTPEAAR